MCLLIYLHHYLQWWKWRTQSNNGSEWWRPIWVLHEEPYSIIMGFQLKHFFHIRTPLSRKKKKKESSWAHTRIQYTQVYETLGKFWDARNIWPNMAKVEEMMHQAVFQSFWKKVSNRQSSLSYSNLSNAKCTYWCRTNQGPHSSPWIGLDPNGWMISHPVSYINK